MKLLRKCMTACLMGITLLPPGLYTEALASPPMPYVSGVDCALEGTELWKTLSVDTDLYWQDVNGRLDEDLDRLVVLMQTSSSELACGITHSDNSPMMP